MKPILSYCCEIWSIWGSKSSLDDLDRIELSFLKQLLGVQVHTKTLHVLAEFGCYPLRLFWMDQAAKFARKLDLMEPERLLKQAFLADCRLPAHLSWWTHLSSRLRPYLESTPTEEDPTLQTVSMRVATLAQLLLVHADRWLKQDISVQRAQVWLSAGSLHPAV